MQKRKPLVPKKDEWNKENYQGKTKEQVDDSNTFAAFAIICLLATLLEEVTGWEYEYLVDADGEIVEDENGDPTGNLDLNEAFRFLNDLMTQSRQGQFCLVASPWNPSESEYRAASNHHIAIRSA